MEFIDSQVIQKDINIKRKQKTNRRAIKVDILYFFILILCMLFLLVLLLPVLRLITVNNINNFLRTLNNQSNLLSIKLSILTTLISTTIVYVFCTPITFFFIFHKNKLIKNVIDILTTIPTILPPAIAGIGLMLTFNRNSFFGIILNYFNIQIEFSTIAVIIAQVFVSSGLYIQVIKSAIQKIDKEVFEISYVLGANKSVIFIKIVLPIIKYSVVNGLILSAARSLGEFGATLMFAGNIEGITRTIPLQIMTLMQSDIYAAYSLSGFVLVFTILILAIIKHTSRGDV
ncbi:molybdate ABC transporter permease subunit [Caldicellulosiruptoraceae bacterium PP1]